LHGEVEVVHEETEVYGLREAKGKGLVGLAADEHRHTMTVGQRKVIYQHAFA
jgi:hypothetical protein